MKNYFDIFLLSPKAEIDLEYLEKKYLTFQQQFHPDNSSTADIEKSILVNEAYEVLKNPLRRATHILQLNGIDIENDSTAPKVDSKTLLEILEIREKISESSFDEIEMLKKDLNSKIKSLLNDAALKLDIQDFTTATQIVIRAKYFDKTLKDLKKK
jgi:molecular chaperone HscB